MNYGGMFFNYQHAINHHGHITISVLNYLKNNSKKFKIQDKVLNFSQKRLLQQYNWYY